jgi:hypothetical protein
MTLIWHSPCFLHKQKREITFKENIPIKILTMTLVTVLAVTALSAYAFAYGPGLGRGHGGGGFYGPDTSFLSRLNLTPEQQKKVKSFKVDRGFGPGVRGGAGYPDGGRCAGVPDSGPGYGPRGN